MIPADHGGTSMEGGTSEREGGWPDDSEGSFRNSVGVRPEDRAPSQGESMDSYSIPGVTNAGSGEEEREIGEELNDLCDAADPGRRNGEDGRDEDATIPSGGRVLDRE